MDVGTVVVEQRRNGDASVRFHRGHGQRGMASGRPGITLAGSKSCGTGIGECTLRKPRGKRPTSGLAMGWAGKKTDAILRRCEIEHAEMRGSNTIWCDVMESRKMKHTRFHGVIGQTTKKMLSFNWGGEESEAAVFGSAGERGGERRCAAFS